MNTAQQHFTRAQVEAFVLEVHTPRDGETRIEIKRVEIFPELGMPFWKVSYDVVDRIGEREYRTRLTDLLIEHEGASGVVLWPLVGKELLS